MNPIVKLALLLITFLLGSGLCVAQIEKEGFRCPDRNVSARPSAKINLGDVTNKALYLPRPKYPTLAKTSGIYGPVKTEVVIDINSGQVVWAFVVSGHPLLKSAVSDVVCRARFAPTNDADGLASGSITYRFARRR
jgi:TonB family protein